jgi:serine/threonine protein kinase/cytochrome c-type biogenesis protein CcmH/NrfG
MALPIGTILDGKFKIVQVIGEGGMGTVYKVEMLNKPGYYRAIKELLINPSTSDVDRRSAIERFNKEIDLLQNLKHSRIPTFFDDFDERGNHYFVMEFVPGKSLDKVLEESNKPLDENDVIRWMMQVCEALSYIHSQNPPIILRDLKPGNIMLMPNGEVQLIDFGIARRFDPNKKSNTENLGTISYASPEHLGSLTSPGTKRSAQNPGKPVQTDARSDIYSLGATMYHLLTNYEPDPIQTPAPGSIRAKNPRLRTVRSGNLLICPVEQVIIKAMQQNPAMRFQNADAMRMALQQCLPNYNNNTPNTALSTVQIPAMSPNATIVVPASGLICPKCGFQNRPGAKFCKRDGQPLTQGATVVPPSQSRIPSTVRRSAPIQARPINTPLPGSSAPQPIRARPVTTPPPRSSLPQPIRARPITATPTVPPQPDALSAYRLGLQYFNNKNYAASIQQFKLAQANGKPSYDTLYNLGRAYRQYAQSLQSKDPQAFMENMRLAAEQFDRATRLKPNGFNACFQLGMCYREMKLYPQAEKAFKSALQLAPQDVGTLYQLGLVAEEQQNKKEAVTYFLEGLKASPDHALILIALGKLYLDMDRADDAIDTLRHASQKQPEPTLAEAWYQLGRAHMKKRQWKFALSALEQARQRDTNSAATYSAMAACYQKISKKAEARTMIDETLRRDPTNQEALRVQKQL